VAEPTVQLDPQTEFDPDLVVVRLDQIGGAKFTEPPLLVVEVRSPSTALADLSRRWPRMNGSALLLGRES
jgi:Uma2 family endonuclease